MEKEKKKKTNKKFIVVISIMILAGLLIGGYYYVRSRSHENTNDAQVKSNMIPVIPHVGGYIDHVYVKDNANVQKGDTLFTIDSNDYDVQLAQAKAHLEEAKSQLIVAKASIGSSKAHFSASEFEIGTALGSIETAKIKLRRAKKDYERYARLYKNNSITRQKFEQAQAAKEQAEKELEIMQKRKQSSVSQSKAAGSQTNIAEKKVSVASAKVESAKAVLRKAKLDQEYTAVTAPFNGQLSAVDIKTGQYVSPGESLFYLVDSKIKWIVANFKETQLTKMEIGQAVKIEVDAFPGTTFKGKVDAFSPATGARFSLLPPDNATGNFVKTVQRLPVKITFTENNKAEDLQKLRSGMNAVVDVHL